MRERAIRIGKPTPLISVVSEPKDFDNEKPAVIILNSGVMHHVGACRISVKIARLLAANGVFVLRFDFSGIGDSEPRRGGLAFEEIAPLEVKEVMDYLEQKKTIKKFILYGLCSGADGAFETAKIDPRVIAMIQIDAYCYKTPRWYLNHYGPKIFKLAVWKNSVKIRLTAMLSKLGRTRDSGNIEEIDDYIEEPTYIRAFPPKNEVEKGLSQLVVRGVHLYNIFTGGQYEILNYQSQYEEGFNIDFQNRLRVDYYPVVSHIVTEYEYQQIIPQNICDWVVVVCRVEAELNGI